MTSEGAALYPRPGPEEGQRRTIESHDEYALPCSVLSAPTMFGLEWWSGPDGQRYDGLSRILADLAMSLERAISPDMRETPGCRAIPCRMDAYLRHADTHFHDPSPWSPIIAAHAPHGLAPPRRRPSIPVPARAPNDHLDPSSRRMPGTS